MRCSPSMAMRATQKKRMSWPVSIICFSQERVRHGILEQASGGRWTTYLPVMNPYRVLYLHTIGSSPKHLQT